MTLQTGSSRKNSPYPGFTLIELILIVVIVAAIAAVSTPMFKRTYDDLRLSSSAKELAMMMQFCHERSIFERQQYRLYLYPDRNAYRIHSYDDESGEFKPAADRWGRTFKIKEGVTMETESSYVDFFPDGSASQAAVILGSKDKQLLNIEVDKSTGSVNVREIEKK